MRSKTIRLSRKYQATIPVAVLRATGIRPGNRLIVEAVGPGEIRLTRTRDRLEPFAGRLTGVYTTGLIDRLREW